MKIPYGFIADHSGRITFDKAQAEVVQMIYREHVSENSLGRSLDCSDIGHPTNQF